MLVIFLCLSFVNYQWVWEVSGMFPGQIYLDKIKEDWLLFYVFLLFPTDCHSKKRLLLKVAFLYLFSCFSLASILSSFAQVVQCTKHSLFIAFSHLFVPTCREEQHDVIAIGDWNQKLSFYQLSGKQVESFELYWAKAANCQLHVKFPGFCSISYNVFIFIFIFLHLYPGVSSMKKLQSVLFL